MKAKVGFIAAVLTLIAVTPAALYAQDKEPPPAKTAAIALAIIGLGVYDQIHTNFIAAIGNEITPGNEPTLKTYYAALVARGFLDAKSYALPDSFLYAASLTAMDFFAQLKPILAPNAAFVQTDLVPDSDGTMVTVMTKITLNRGKPKGNKNDDDDDDDDEGAIVSADTLDVTFIRDDHSRIQITYSETLKAGGVIVGRGTFAATTGDRLTAVMLKIKGTVEFDENNMRLMRVASNSAERKTRDVKGKLVDVVKSEHTGRYTIQDVAAWSYYEGITANERDSLVNLINGVCGPTHKP